MSSRNKRKFATRGSAELTVSYCPECKSTLRKRYDRVPQVEKISGVRRIQTVFGTVDLPYNQIVTRATECLNCGEARVDRSYELV